MKRIKFSRELLVGLLGLAAMFVIYFLINFFKSIDIFDDTDQYRIEFTNIGELTNSAPVYLNGCKVGNVSAIEHNFNESDKVYLTVSIDKGLRLPEGSYAQIHNKLMGGSTICLIMGNGNGTIEPGSTMKGVLEAGAMGEVGNMVPQIEAMLPKVDSMLSSLNGILSNPAINNTLNNLETLTAQLNNTSAGLNSLVNNDIPKAIDKVVKLEDDLLKVSSQLSEVDYKNMIATLETSLNNIQEITTALNEGNGTVGMLLKDTTLYGKLNETCEAANALLEDLKENPKRYVHFSVFGNKEKEEKK
ncbi:MAG: MCE family protein [Bacteroidaceae bacterium]|nr:MCE family protein [Bacteroidaceae bacterium]